MQTENKHLFEKGASIYKEMENLVNVAKNEGRAMTKEEELKFDSLNDEHLAIEKTIQANNKLSERKSTFEQKIEEGAERKGQSKEQFEEEGKRMFDIQTKFFRKGLDGLTNEERAILNETRAQTAGTDSAGGYTVDSMIADEIIKSLAYYGPMRSAAKVITTATGGDLIYPTNNDTANVGAILTEAAQGSEQDTTFGATTISAFMYYSKVVTVSAQLIQDSAFDIIDYIVRELFVERIGRIQNTHFTTGSGSSQPLGVLNAASVGAVAAADTAITFDDILDLKHSVDPAYRMDGAFMFNDSTLKAIKKLSVGSSDARPLWQPSFVAGEPATIDGDRYWINNDMPDIAAGKHVALYGDFSKYLIRDVQGMQVKRSDDRYFEYLKVGLVAYMRSDADLLDTSAIKALRMSNT